MAISREGLTIEKKGKANRKKAKPKATQGTMKMYSQNVHGIFESLKDEEGKAIKGERLYAKREWIIRKMQKDDINAYLMQETWEQGNHVVDMGHE